MRRYITALVLALLAATASAVPASAHAELKSSNPASGATLDVPPQKVELTFSEVVGLPDGAAVTVTGPDGVAWAVTQATIADTTVTAVVDTAAAKAGAHTLAWKVESSDGDVVEGKFAFTLAKGAQPSVTPTTTTVNPPVSTPAPPSTTPAESGGMPAWVWILIGLAVLVGVILLVRRRKTD